MARNARSGAQVQPPLLLSLLLSLLLAGAAAAVAALVRAQNTVPRVVTLDASIDHVWLRLSNASAQPERANGANALCAKRGNVLGLPSRSGALRFAATAELESLAVLAGNSNYSGVALATAELRLALRQATAGPSDLTLAAVPVAAGGWRAVDLTPGDFLLGRAPALPPLEEPAAVTLPMGTPAELSLSVRLPLAPAAALAAAQAAAAAAGPDTGGFAAVAVAVRPRIGQNLEYTGEADTAVWFHTQGSAAADGRTFLSPTLVFTFDVPAPATAAASPSATTTTTTTTPPASSTGTGVGSAVPTTTAVSGSVSATTASSSSSSTDDGARSSGEGANDTGGAGGGFQWWLIVVIVAVCLCCIVALAVAAVVLRRRRESRDDDDVGLAAAGGAELESSSDSSSAEHNYNTIAGVDDTPQAEKNNTWDDGQPIYNSVDVAINADDPDGAYQTYTHEESPIYNTLPSTTP